MTKQDPAATPPQAIVAARRYSHRMGMHQRKADPQCPLCTNG
jgi:hypothetical protein